MNAVLPGITNALICSVSDAWRLRLPSLTSRLRVRPASCCRLDRRRVHVDALDLALEAFLSAREAIARSGAQDHRFDHFIGCR